MRIIKFLLQKEFRQIFRNKALLPMIFFAPIIQLIVMPLAADYEIKNINIAVVDYDHSTYSQKLIGKITGSGYFVLTEYTASFPQALGQIESDKADLILEIPHDFEKNLVKEGRQKLFIAVNAINGTKAGLGGNYLSKIITDFNKDIRLKLINSAAPTTPTISATATNWYNPHFNYRIFMVPGILVSLVTMVAMYMCSLNIVKEKEVGTIEQINVTPIKKWQFILGKIIPFWVIGMFLFTVGLFGVGRIIFGLIPMGNMPMLYAYLSVFLVAMLGLGLIISNYSETQQQAMSVAFFFMMIFMLMSGLFTPLDSMPEWAKIIAKANPVTYFIEVMRMVVLKGSGFKDIRSHFFITVAFAVGLNAWAIYTYKKTS